MPKASLHQSGGVRHSDGYKSLSQSMKGGVGRVFVSAYAFVSCMQASQHCLHGQSLSIEQPACLIPLTMPHLNSLIAHSHCRLPSHEDPLPCSLRPSLLNAFRSLCSPPSNSSTRHHTRPTQQPFHASRSHAAGPTIAPTTITTAATRAGAASADAPDFAGSCACWLFCACRLF